MNIQQLEREYDAKFHDWRAQKARSPLMIIAKAADGTFVVIASKAARDGVSDITAICRLDVDVLNTIACQKGNDLRVHLGSVALSAIQSLNAGESYQDEWERR